MDLDKMKQNEIIVRMNNFVRNHETKKNIFNVLKDNSENSKLEKELMKFDGLLSNERVPETYGQLYNSKMENDLSTIENFVNNTIQNNSRIVEDYNLGSNTKDISNIHYSSDDSSFIPLTTVKMIKNEPHQPDTGFGGFLNPNQRQYLLNQNSNMQKLISNEAIQYKPLSSTFTGPPIKKDEISLNRKIRNSHNKKSFDSESESVDSFIARYPMPSVRPIRPTPQPYSYIYSNDNPPYNLGQDFNKEHIKEYNKEYYSDNRDVLLPRANLRYQIKKEDKMKQLGIFPDTISIIDPIKENNEKFNMMVEEHDKKDFDKNNKKVSGLPKPRGRPKKQT
jgi:hypothetical protein